MINITTKQVVPVHFVLIWLCLSHTRYLLSAYVPNYQKNSWLQTEYE